MEIGTGRTILLMLVSGVVGGIVALAGAAFLMIYWSTGGIVRGFSVTTGGITPERVSSAPRVTEDDNFLGTMGVHSDQFTARSDKVLDGGPGRIVGLVTANGAPVQGVRLRLALNGGVKSEWGVTGADGRYAIALPYGRYRIDGYDLDGEAARRVLKGKTDSPSRHFETALFLVEEGKPGTGLELHYVDPVRIVAPEGVVPTASPVVLSWAPYPNAQSYKLQLMEFVRPGDWSSHKYVFNWKERPVVNGTSVDLASVGATLTKGRHYSVQIEALDASGRPIASNGSRIDRVNFSLSE